MAKATRKATRKTCGGFYPSIMGGVIVNAPFLIPAALREGLTLVSRYRKSRKATRRRATRKTLRKKRHT